jgi:hypothetical protein
VTIIGDMKKNKSITIPYGILQDAAKYYNTSIKPLALYYIICTKYLLPLLDNNNYITQSLQKYCEKDILETLKLDKMGDWNCVLDILEKIYGEKIQFLTCNNVEKNILAPHNYVNLDFECSGKTITDSKCDVCGIVVNYTKIDKTDAPNLSHIKSDYLMDLSKHIDLGMLDGMPDSTLIDVNDFSSKYDSFNVTNTMIIDPISNARLKITTQDEFIHYAYLKYPFLKNVDMNNVALCGGFVRSILLKQQMKDFDFFFYGLNDNQGFIDRLKKLVTDMTTSLRNINDKFKFVFFYKPQFNVIEMICYEDPADFIQEDYTLEFFDQYKFKCMKKYNREYHQNNDDNESNEESDEESNDGSEEEVAAPAYVPINKKYYFEDGDKHGVKMIHRIQFVMCKYNTISDIFKSFDMFPSQVAFDGKKVYFTPKSLTAYQYMINELNLYGGTCLAKHRSSKYFKYGFSIVFPQSERKWELANYDNKTDQDNMYYKGTNENIGPLKFKVRKVDGNMIYINHNSNYEQMMNRNEELEKKAHDAGTSLYTSTLFCSFVAVLRYVRINDINYAFPQNDQLDELFDANKINLKNGKVDMSFLEKQTTVFTTKDWYEKFVQSIVLENY